MMSLRTYEVEERRQKTRNASKVVRKRAPSNSLPEKMMAVNITKFLIHWLTRNSLAYSNIRAFVIMRLVNYTTDNKSSKQQLASSKQRSFAIMTA